MVGYTPTEVADKTIKDWRNKFLAISSAVTAFLLLIACVLKTDWVPALSKNRDFSVTHLGEEFLYTYCLAFELISVILLVAIIGSIILARGGREEGFKTIEPLRSAKGNYPNDNDQ
jgi:NADH-quinone oxidoreductase subunit J